MRIRLALTGIALFASSLAGQEVNRPKDHHPSKSDRAQSKCENQLIRDMEAEEVFAGPEYEMLVSVTNAFGREKTPRFYLYEATEGTGNNVYYLAGSVILDGRGKFLMARKFAEIMGSTLALKGSIAHEMAHLIRNPATGERCTDWVYINPKTEQEADAIAAGKVGFESLKAWFLRVREWTKEKSFSDISSRIEALEAIEAKQKEQRN